MKDTTETFAGAASYAAPEEIEALVRAFRDRSLPRTDWTHAAHLTVGLWHVLEHGWPDAVDRVREGILALNAAHGVETTPTSGYHETITVFWARVLRAYVAGEGRNKTLLELANGVVARFGARDVPFAYYTRDRLMSTDARFGWVEPDLAPLPEVDE